uniref:Ig-like domain-containing protein n=1 Tax=Trichobilharzia regenti TaxID=157069 RepID=A0AA85JRF6_TRIRE|nr:unnamed protein product [Trichobilharzia regenti]
MLATYFTWSILNIYMVAFWITIWFLNYCETFVLPEFQSLPESTVYYTGSETLEICCDIWPKSPIGHVTYYSTYHSPYSTHVNTSDQISTKHMTVHHRNLYRMLPSLLCEHHPSDGNKPQSSINCLCFSNISIVEQFSGEEIYCLGSSDFGSILSRPFQVLLKSPVVQKVSIPTILKYNLGNIAVIPCSLEKVHSSDEVFFTLNNTDITHLFSAGKYRFVQSLSTGHYTLMIRDFQLQDQGFYQCGYFNHRLGTKRYNPVIYHLLAENPFNSSMKTILLMDFNGSSPDSPTVIDSRKSVVEITAYENQNISLFCVFNSPNPLVAKVDDYSVMNGFNEYHSFDSLFGVLDIQHLTMKDEGLYFCSADNVTSYAHLRILSSPQLMVYPKNIQANLGDSFNLSCIISSRNDLTPFWCFNGICKQSTVSINPYHANLLIDSLQLSDIGVYQCIIKNDINMWIDSIVTVITLEQFLLSKSLFDTTLSKILAPIQLETDLLEIQFGDTGQLKCLSFNEVSVNSSKGSEIKELMLHSDKALINLLSIPYLFKFIRVEWLKDDKPLRMSAYNFSDHPELASSVPYATNVTINNPNDYGMYSCNVYLGEKLILQRYFYLIRSDTSAYAVDSSKQVNQLNGRFMNWSKRLLEKSSRQNNILNIDQTPIIPLHRVRRSQAHRINEWPLHSGQITSLDILNLSSTRNTYDRLRKPNATTVGDNLAVLISWNSVNCDFYRILHRSRIPESDGWIHRSTIDETVKECCSHDKTCCLENKHFYLTSRHPGELVPGKSYQFRIHAIKQDNDEIVDKSPWSDPVSFQHISKVAPVITETERLEHKLQALEPGKGYQIVVYGVHTPPGFDPQATIFTGGLNGRKITQFSHEVFVKPRSISVMASDKLDSQDSDLRSTSKSRDHYNNNKNIVAFNSMESNKLMFLILGALTSVMLLIMICLVVLCICRQRRDKHRLVINRTAGGGGVCDNYNLPCNQATDKSLKKGNHLSGGFLLDNLHSTPLTTSPNVTNDNRVMDNINFEQNNKRTGVQLASRPPPMSPAPPPPPKYLTRNENFELRSLISSNDENNNNQQSTMDILSKSYYYPVHRNMNCTEYPVSPSCHTIMNHTNHDVVVDNASFANPHLLLLTSSCTDKSMIDSPGLMENSTNHKDSNYLLQSAMLNGLKREPPSGGSMHGGTDDEFALPDKDAVSNRSHQQCEQPQSTEFCSYSHCNPNLYHSYHNDNVSGKHNGEKSPAVIVSTNQHLDFYPNHFHRTVSSSFRNDSNHHQHRRRHQHHHHYQQQQHQQYQRNGCNIYTDESNAPPFMMNFNHHYLAQQQQPMNIMFTSCIPNYDPGLLTPPSPNPANFNKDYNDNNNNSHNHSHHVDMYNSQYTDSSYPINNEVKHPKECHHPRSHSFHVSHTDHQSKLPSSSLHIHPDIMTASSTNPDKNLKYFGLSQSTNRRYANRSIQYDSNPPAQQISNTCMPNS